MSAELDISDFENLEEKELIKKMKAKSNTGLAETVANKREASTKAVAKLFEKMEAGELSPAPVTAPVPVKAKLNEEAPPTPRPTEPIRVTQQLNRPIPVGLEPVNKENEPVNIAWRPTTVQQLVALYPKSTAVSDLYMVLHGATQQPGFTFALLAPHGTRYLVRADTNGGLFMADPNPNPAAFANIGLNPDFDGDAVDDSNPDSMKPFSQNSHRILNKFESKDEFKLDTNFKEKIDRIDEVRHEIPTESLTNPKIKDTVTKLRSMAAELRGEQINKPSVKSADGSNKQLLEHVEPVYTIKKLNTMLYKAQDKFNQTGNKVYESIADELSSVIAEALLVNKTSIPKSKISKITRAAF